MYQKVLSFSRRINEYHSTRTEDSFVIFRAFCVFVKKSETGKFSLHMEMKHALLKGVLKFQLSEKIKTSYIAA